MSYLKRKISLLSVCANENSVLFKINIDGEERVFIGQQNNTFSIAPTSQDDDKLNSSIKTTEAFQKAYIIDKGITDADELKDIIVPVAFSKEIVQLGNYMFTMTKETNNRVLWLLYKNRLFNRYYDDSTDLVYYDLDLSMFDDTTPDGILNTLRTEYFTQEVISSTNIAAEAYETKSQYGNMPGHIESLKDEKYIKSSIEDMPFNLIYEAGTERQYEDEVSPFYVNFFQLKNYLSPFFNVEVDTDYKFKLWRDYLKIANADNLKMWMSYKLNTPISITTEENTDAAVIGLGNLPFSDINPVNLTTIGELDSKESISQGFSIGVITDRQEFLDRLKSSYFNKYRSNLNKDNNYLIYTPEQFAQYLIDNSDGAIQKKNSFNIYPQGTNFVLEITEDEDEDDVYITVSCITDDSSINVKDSSLTCGKYQTLFYFTCDGVEYSNTSIDIYLDMVDSEDSKSSANSKVNDISSGENIHIMRTDGDMGYVSFWTDDTFSSGDSFTLKNPRVAAYPIVSNGDDTSICNTNYYNQDEDIPLINYVQSVLELREYDKTDPELTAEAPYSNITDFFGTAVYSQISDDIISVYNKAISYIENKTNIDNVVLTLTVGYKNALQENAIVVKSYIDGRLLNTFEITEEEDSEAYSGVQSRLTSTDSIKLWAYQDNSITETAQTLNYTDISVWNYTLDDSQVKYYSRAYYFGTDVADILNQTYSVQTVLSSEQLIQDSSGELTKLFSAQQVKTVKSYDYNSSDALLENQKLYKIQDFEFIDTIKGIHKLTETGIRKSNLYSIKLSNTGLISDDTDDEETAEFKTSMKAALESAINTICEKTQPLNTNLFKIIFES